MLSAEAVWVNFVAWMQVVLDGVVTDEYAAALG